MLKIILFCGLAGIIGTSLGGLIGIFLAKRFNNSISVVLTFTGGIMISISMFDLMPEAHELSSSIVVALGVLLGVFIIFLLDYFFNKILKDKQQVFVYSSQKLSLPQKNAAKQGYSNQSLFRAGVIISVAIALHNVPEGVAIGASSVVSVNLSFTLAILLAFHNIIEGMAIAMPFSATKISSLKILIFTFLVGSSTILGGVIGAFVGSLGKLGTALSLSFAAGAMLYVTFCEILPQCTISKQGKLSALFSIFGILFGFIVTKMF